MLFCKGDVIKLTDLPDEFIQGTSEASEAKPETEEKAAPESNIDINSDTSLKEIVRAQTNKVERELITKALDETGGNVTQAAKLLKISRKSLQMKMKLFDLRDREGEGPT